MSWPASSCRKVTPWAARVAAPPPPLYLWTSALHFIFDTHHPMDGYPPRPGKVQDVAGGSSVSGMDCSGAENCRFLMCSRAVLQCSSMYLPVRAGRHSLS